MTRPAIRILLPAVFLIVLSAYLSVNLAGEWHNAGNTGQRISTIVEAGYCVFGLLAGLAALWRPLHVRALRGCWVFCVAAAGAAGSRAPVS